MRAQTQPMSKRIYTTRNIKNRRADVIENPRVRSISRLLNYNFYVPRYQRGYRWGKQEIIDLLDDILKYHTILRQANPFYCLQPVVVKKKTWKGNDDQKIVGWEVIDGQQRLTTILIILNYLQNIDPESMKAKLGEELNFYTIDFEARVDVKDFLQNKIYTKEIVDTNVEFYNISKAYQYISEWFNQDEVKAVANVNNIMLNALLDTENNVSIIWYEFFGQYGSKATDSDKNSIDLFIRLNEGKVPLTDAELIKAMLLQSELYPAGEKKYVKQRLHEIAAEWDAIEAKLQDDKMWFFFNNLSYQPILRIEYLLKMLSEKWNGYENQTLVKYSSEEEKSTYFDFLVFKKQLKNIRKSFQDNLSDQSHVMDPINQLWAEVKNLFAVLEEWYKDHKLYHYIGYLLTINSESNKVLLKELTELQVDKDEFLHHIKNKIAQAIVLNKDLKDLRYGEDNKSIIKLLFLMDIEAMVKQEKENARLPFHLYKKERINSITHINPQVSHSIDTNEANATIWLQLHKQSLTAIRSDSCNNGAKLIDTLLPQLDSLLNDFHKENYEKVVTKTIELNNNMAGMKDNEMHALQNLVLLDKETNHQLKNSFFDVKQNLLKENTSGKYIPIHTQRAFSKYYTESPREMIYWNVDDKQKYFAAINKVYDLYVQHLNQLNDK